MSKFSHAHISTYADNLPVCCTVNHTFRTPQKQSLLSPLRISKGKQKNLKYLDIWILQTSKRLSQRMQWSLPPLTTL